MKGDGAPARARRIHNYLLGLQSMAKTLTIWMKDEDMDLLKQIDGSSMSEKIRMCIHDMDPVRVNHYESLIRHRDAPCRKCGK